jgi:hypothetical protein
MRTPVGQARELIEALYLDAGALQSCAAPVELARVDGSGVGPGDVGERTEDAVKVQVVRSDESV